MNGIWIVKNERAYVEKVYAPPIFYEFIEKAETMKI